MQTTPTLEERLWDYIDGQGSPADRAAMEALLAADPTVRAQYAGLLAVHESLGASGFEEPSMRFTKNVMEAVARQSIAPATGTYINKRIIRVIAAFFLTAIGAVLGYTLFLAASSGFDSGADAGDGREVVHVPSFTFPALHLDPYVGVFMLVAIVSGFVVLDKYLSRQKIRRANSR